MIRMHLSRFRSRCATNHVESVASFVGQFWLYASAHNFSVNVLRAARNFLTPASDCFLIIKASRNLPSRPNLKYTPSPGLLQSVVQVYENCKYAWVYEWETNMQSTRRSMLRSVCIRLFLLQTNSFRPTYPPFVLLGCLTWLPTSVKIFARWDRIDQVAPGSPALPILSQQGLE